MSDLGIEHTAEGECINMHSDKDINVYAAHDEAIEITNDRTIKVVNGKHTETIKGDTTIKITDGKLDHDVASGTAKFHVQGAVTEIYSDKQETTVTKEIVITSGTSHIYLNGSTSIHLHVGSSQICMNSDGSILIQGKHITINATEKVEISGGDVISTAQSKNEMHGDAVLSDGKTSATVKGGMVMLNP